MRLAQLRHQMLVAMGLPACWTQPVPSTKPVDPTPVAAYTPPPRKVEPELARFSSKSCDVDQIVESVCGRHSGEYCDQTAAKLELSNNAEGLYVTSLDDARASAKDWILDDKASDAYVARLQALNEKLDGKPACCHSRCTSLAVGLAKPPPSPMPAYHMRQETCMPTPPKGTSQPDVNNAACPQGVTIQGELRPYSSARNADQCCYVSVTKRVIIQKGRPARVEGEPRFADVHRSPAGQGGTAWHAALSIDVSSLDAETRAKLSAHWLEAARMEHASVAAFSTTALRLMSFGAPPELIAAAHRAALDEIEHARIAFALASTYADAVSPGRMDMQLTPMTLREFAIETFVDGCVGETAAALEAERAAGCAVDPQLAGVLAKIAIDEARHAELAWSIVRWCVQQDPTIMAALEVDAPAIDGDDALEMHGVLDARERRAAYDDVMREVVSPCLAALAALAA